jgi:predicted HNH restriction endonuclease
VWPVAAVRCRGTLDREPPGWDVSHARRKALEKLGGACACCSLGIEYARVLEFHHVNHNGALHREVMRALDTGVRGWILTHPDPAAGLFAIEVLCVNCHRMLHEAGRCPHRRKERVKRAA